MPRIQYDIVQENDPYYNLVSGDSFANFDSFKEFKYQMDKYFPELWNYEEISRRKNGDRAESLIKCTFKLPNSSRHPFFIYLCQIEGGGRRNMPYEQRIQFREHSKWVPDLNTLNVANNFIVSDDVTNAECYLIGIYKRSENDHDVIFTGIHPKWMYDKCIESYSTSPTSFQVKIYSFQKAYQFGQDIFTKEDGQRAICFKPHKILWYMENRDKLHLDDLNKVKMMINNQLPRVEGQRQIIYYGAPGTGKSHKIKEILGEYEECPEDQKVPKANIFRTTFHPDSDYSTFVGAYKPTKGKKPLYGLKGGSTVRLNDGTNDLEEDIITYKFIPQVFLNAYIRAYQTNENVYLIIEEINRGNCAQIFGDLFQLLDRDGTGKSEYTIKADEDLKAFLEEKLGEDKPGIKDGELCLPSNLYIYATMNTSDQSLFPIDSAFKRRWDWEYEPIKYKNTDWVIDIDGLKYSWSDFQKEVNTRILKDTGSEDKMLGDYFVNPQTKDISYDLFRNKILFYLWNDVCKDGDADIFPTDDDFSFSKLYDENSKQLIVSMMEKLNVKTIDGNGTEDNKDGNHMLENEDNNPSVRYSINGEETDEEGKAWGKGALVKRAVEIYCNNHNQDTADQIRDVWMSANFIIPHIVETDEDRKQRIESSKDPNAERRSKEIKLPNGESLHVSTQVGDGEQRKSFSDFLSKIKSKPEWGINIQEL